MDSSTEYLTHDISIKKYLYFGVKRLFDILIALIGCLFLLPIILIVKISYLLHKDFDSIFFRQKRIGKNGKEFNLYKFRSMIPNADEVLKELLKDPKYKEEWDLNQKFEHDPRITSMGNILRKTSLDELPQIINILKGDMSIIGPRPVVDDEIEKYGKDKAKFLSVKPGLTGYWAANGRSATTYEDRINMELYYVDHCSLLLDIQIFFKTILSVLKKEGAK